MSQYFLRGLNEGGEAIEQSNSELNNYSFVQLGWGRVLVISRICFTLFRFFVDDDHSGRRNPEALASALHSEPESKGSSALSFALEGLFLLPIILRNNTLVHNYTMLKWNISVLLPRIRLSLPSQGL